MSDLIRRSEVMEMLTNIELSCTVIPITEAKLQLRDIPAAYNDSWIPCSVRLPEEPKEELDEQHDIERAILLGHVTKYIVTIEDATEPTALYYVGDGFWYDEKAEDFCRVAAWRPFMPAWQQDTANTEEEE